MKLTALEIGEKVRPILSELIQDVKVEGNLLHSLRLTPTENSVVFYVASINVATKIHTGKEKLLLLEKDAETLKWVINSCETFLDPVAFTTEGGTYHWFFFPDMKLSSSGN